MAADTERGVEVMAAPYTPDAEAAAETPDGHRKDV
jgi:hypothetical protein